MTFYVVHNTGYHMIRIGHIKKKHALFSPMAESFNFVYVLDHSVKKLLISNFY
jgi:hypothetical protein